ncbi:hypothetical protein GCM10010211_74770 [Streptomyces albospinus]|uniref:Uncharacterized protein n=1 Tax=Streptomyces albospinus TaxID=285515 RepID=A0ABQ2VNZ9_9ACTN|nr:hypothetical protein GCM10010211_74770 [Streptomyces albospinus]
MQTLVNPVIDQGRGIVTRYEKAATIYPAGLHIAGIFPWSARRSKRKFVEKFVRRTPSANSQNGL